MAIPLLNFSYTPILPTASPVQSLDSIIQAKRLGAEQATIAPDLANSIATGITSGIETYGKLESQQAATELNRANAELARIKAETLQIQDANGQTLAALQAQADLAKAKQDLASSNRAASVMSAQQIIDNGLQSGDPSAAAAIFKDPKNAIAFEDKNFADSRFDAALQSGVITPDEYSIYKGIDAKNTLDEISAGTAEGVTKNQENAFNRVASEPTIPALLPEVGSNPQSLVDNLAKIKVVPATPRDKDGNAVAPLLGDEKAYENKFDLMLDGKKLNPVPIDDSHTEGTVGKVTDIKNAIEFAKNQLSGLNNDDPRKQAYNAYIAKGDKPDAPSSEELFGGNSPLTPEAQAKIKALSTRSPQTQASIQEGLASTLKEFSVPVATPAPVATPTPPDFKPTSYVAQKPANTKAAKVVNESPVLSQLPLVVKGIAVVESGGDPNAKSPRKIVNGKILAGGATGAMQVFQPATTDVERAKGLAKGSLDFNNPEHNAFIGQEYYKLQVDRFKNPVLALAAYNGGPGIISVAVNRAGSTDWNIVKEYLPQVLLDWGRNNLPSTINLTDYVKNKMKELRDYPERVIAQLPHLADTSSDNYQILEYFKNLGHLKRG